MRSISKFMPFILSASGALLAYFLSASPARALETHPSLYFGSEDIPVLREKILTSPRSEWWDDVRNNDELLSYGAFEYLMTGDTAILEEVKAALAGPLEKITGWYGPYSGGAQMMDLALAYDFIAADLSPEEDSQIRDNLADLWNYYFWGFISPADGVYDGGDYPAHVNLRMRLGGGAGMLALAMRDYTSAEYGNAQDWLAFVIDDYFGDHVSDPPDWPIPGSLGYAEYSEDAIGHYMEMMVDADGVYKEGLSYIEDSFSVTLPFILAVDRVTGTDYMHDPSFANLWTACVKLSMPNRRQPTFDSGFMGSFQFLESVASAYPDVVELMWLWEEGGRVVDAWWNGLLPIVFFDDALLAGAREPDYSTVFMPAGGYAVFRSDWSSEAVYMLLLSEHVPDLSCHETPDQTSFLIYAKGVYMAIDPGDGRAYLDDACDTLPPRTARSHNLIVVDDQESPEVVHDYVDVKDPAYLENSFTVPFFDHTETRMHYDGVDVDLVREVVFVDKGYFVMADALSPADTASHAYDWQLHFGSASGLEIGDNEVSWTEGDAQLRTVFVHPGVSIASSVMGTNYGNSEETFDHTYIRASASGSDVRFLTMLYPRNTTETDPEVVRSMYGSAWGATVDLGGRVDLILGQANRETASAERYSTDARLMIASTSGDSLLAFFVRDSSRLELDADALLASSVPMAAVTAAYDAARGVVEGYLLDAGEPYEVTIDTQGIEARCVTLRGVVVESSWSEGKVSFAAEGSGPYVIAGLCPTPPDDGEFSDVNNPENPADADAEGMADGTVDMGADGEDLEQDGIGGGCGCVVAGVSN